MTSLLERLSPVELGKIVDKRVDYRDLVALIVGWARQGVVTIEEHRRKDGVLDYWLCRTGELPDQTPDYERLFFRGIFPRDQREVWVSALIQIRVNEGMKAAKQRLDEHMKRHGFVTRDPKEFLAWLRFWGVALIGAGAVGGIGSGRYELAMGGLVAGLLCLFGFRRAVEALYVEGDPALIQEVRDLREAMATMGLDELRQRLAEDPGFFEQWLPVAVAFNLGSQWLSDFQGILPQVPAWYRLEPEARELSQEEQVQRFLIGLADLIKLLERAAFYASFVTHKAPNFTPGRRGGSISSGGGGFSGGGGGGFSGGGSSGGGASTGGGGGW